MAAVNEWLPVASFVFSVLVTGGSVIWGVGKIKQDISDKIAGEVLAREKALAEAVESRTQEFDKVRREWAEAQKYQDSTVGEMGLSLRRYIEAVEKEMHKIELWGRDNYVQKPELESVRSDIKTLGSEVKQMLAEIKSDLKDDMKELKNRQQS
jgi:hypothetical protein